MQVLHLYVPTGVFTGLMDDYNLPAVPGRSIRYSCGVQDELINQIGNGCRDLLVYCSSVWCNHSATLNADWLPGDTPLRSGGRLPWPG
jgi:hypothetical protein